MSQKRRLAQQTKSILRDDGAEVVDYEWMDGRACVFGDIIMKWERIMRLLLFAKTGERNII